MNLLRGIWGLGLLVAVLPLARAQTQIDVFVLTGQSNSLGTTADQKEKDTGIGRHKADRHVRFYWNNLSTRAPKGGESRRSIGDSGGKFTNLRAQQGAGRNRIFWGPEIGFGRALYDKGRRHHLAIIKVSRAGGGNRFWVKGSADDHMYRALVATVRSALKKLPRGTTARIRALLYLQGESDGKTECKVAGRRLAELAANLRQDLPHATDMRVIVAGIAAAGKNRDEVRRQQSALAEGDKRVSYVDTLDLRDRLYDKVHFDKKAKLEIGARMARAWLAMDSRGSAKTVHDDAGRDTQTIVLDRPFGAGMVLPRDREIPVRGKASPRSNVVVSFGKQEIEAKADAKGHFEARLAAMSASGMGRVLTLADGQSELRLTDVLVGEVWLCAGQSNMGFPISRSKNRAEALGSRRTEIRLLDYNGRLHPSKKRYSKELIGSLQVSNYYASSGWIVGGTKASSGFSAVGWYFASMLQKRLDVPIGLIDISVGGAPVEAFLPRSSFARKKALRGLLSDWLNNDQYPAWCRKRAAFNLQDAKDPKRANHPFAPTFLYEAGVRPLVGFPIRGVLWYQGESNAEDDGVPTPLVTNVLKMRSLINSWRSSWNSEALPFLMVQLPGMKRDWATFRQAQQAVADLVPGVEIAVTIDVGNPKNVHPKNKKPVGERLARLALAKTYGVDVPAFAPRPTASDSKGREFIIQFEGGRLGTPDGKDPTDFEVAGKDGVYHQATATLVDGRITLSSDKVARPVAARYAWRGVTTGNLIGPESLPVAPFKIGR